MNSKGPTDAAPAVKKSILPNAVWRGPHKRRSQYSAAAFNASSSRSTRIVTPVVILAVIPIIIGYQAWVYRLFSDIFFREGRVWEETY